MALPVEKQVVGSIPKPIPLFPDDSPSSVRASGDMLSWLQQQHPIYQKYIKNYGLWKNQFLGGVHLDNIVEYIFKHPRESSELVGGKTSYQRRLDRLHPVNFCKLLTTLYSDTLFKASITRNASSNKKYLPFSTNCDLKGNDIDNFFKNMTTWNQVYGVTGLLVHPADPNNPYSYPYFVSVPPTHIIDWEINNFDESLEYVKIRFEINTGQAFAPRVQTGNDYGYIVYFKNEWIKYDAKGNVTDSAPHSIGQVPFTFVYNGGRDINGVGEGISTLADVGKVNRSLDNISTLLDEICYEQTFSIFMIPITPMQQNPVSITTGIGMGLGFPADTNQPPHYVSPDPGQAKVLQDEYIKLIQLIFWLAMQQYGPTDSSPVAQSGIAKSYDVRNSDQAIAAYANYLEKVENWAHKMWLAYLENTSFRQIDFKYAELQTQKKITVADYPDTFDFIALTELVQNVISINAMKIIPPTMHKILTQAIMKKMKIKISPEDQITLDSEVESMTSSLREVVLRGPNGPYKAVFFEELDLDRAAEFENQRALLGLEQADALEYQKAGAEDQGSLIELQAALAPPPAAGAKKSKS